MQIAVTAAKETDCQNTPLGEKEYSGSWLSPKRESAISVKHSWLL